MNEIGKEKEKERKYLIDESNGAATGAQHFLVIFPPISRNRKHPQKS